MRIELAQTGAELLESHNFFRVGTAKRGVAVIGQLPKIHVFVEADFLHQHFHTGFFNVVFRNVIRHGFIVGAE